MLESWASVGPAGTTIAGIARSAGVQRLTVYRHFEDDAALTAAAWAAFMQQHPPPDPASWANIASPTKRLRRALRAVYEYYAGRAHVLDHVLHDAPRVDALTDAVAAHRNWLDGIVATLETGWSARGGRRNAEMPVRMIEHAVRLSTWRSLADAGLDERAAVRLIERAMRGLARKDTGK
jgi:AcrR family transcriptional regulator